MPIENRRTGQQAELGALFETWAQAIRDKDVGAVMAHYAADVVTFELAPPLQYAGADAVRRSLEAWFPTFQGPVGYEIHDLTITAADDLAFCRSLNRISGTRTSGEETDVWVRATTGLRKINGQWKVVHEHSSVPFYMDGSERAAVDLKP